MKAKELHQWLRSLDEVNESTTVDRIIVGDPDTEAKAIGTCWQSYWDTLKDAVEQGVNVIVTHEPTFYTHHDLREEKQAYPEQVALKKKWIEDNGLVVIRCHDVLDKIPVFGIPFAFGEGLGFSSDGIIRSEMYYNVYRIKPAPAIDVARRIAGKLQAVGQPGVAFYGDADRIIESVGVGTGCGCDPIQFAHLEPDLFIAIDDSVRTWIQTTYARDTGRPLIVVNHGTSEEFGMRALCDRIKEKFTDVRTVHYPQGCTYRWVD